MRHLEPHSKFGSNIRPVINMCVVCQDQYKVGMVPLGAANFKYICPDCNYVHFGYEPDRDKETNNIHCPDCESENEVWIMKELIEGEVVKGGFGICSRCTGKLNNNRMALIEVEDGTEQRTGKVYFVKTPPFLQKYYDEGERYLNVDRSSCKKLGLRKES